MASLDLLLDFFVLLSFAVGSPGIGYIFLRTGWPKIRMIDKSYRKGWSVVFGLGFAVFVTIFSVLFGFFSLFGLGFREYFFIFLAVFFLGAIVLLTAWRKLFRKGKVKVVIPKATVTANVLAQKAKSRLESGPEIVSTREKLPPKQEAGRQEMPIQKTSMVRPLEDIVPKAVLKGRGEGERKIVGLKISDLFGELQGEDERELEDIKEMEKIGKEIEDENPPEELEGDESPLQRLLKEKGKKIKYLKEEK